MQHIYIVVSRNDENPFSSVNKPAKGSDYILMADQFAVFGQITGHQHILNIRFKNLFNGKIQQLGALPEKLAVGQ